jgi:hypothetical protein
MKPPETTAARRVLALSLLTLACLGAQHAVARVSYDEGFLCRIGPAGLEQIIVYVADRPPRGASTHPDERSVRIVDDRSGNHVTGQARCGSPNGGQQCELPNGQRLVLDPPPPSRAPQNGYHELAGKLVDPSDSHEQRARCLVKAR